MLIKIITFFGSSEGSSPWGSTELKVAGKDTQSPSRMDLVHSAFEVVQLHVNAPTIKCSNLYYNRGNLFKHANIGIPIYKKINCK